MFGLNADLRFRLYSSSCDMRKSFDGLCGLIQNDLGTSPTNGTVYIFINKLRNKIKLLQWQSGSFVLYYKRLETGTFDLPLHDDGVKILSLSYPQLVLLIDGITINNIRRKDSYKKSQKTMVIQP